MLIQMKKIICLAVLGGILFCGIIAAVELPDNLFSTYPAVYAVGNEYQITLPVKLETLMWCEVNGNQFYDDFNGVLRSASKIHRMIVPMKDLDAAGRYTICYREVQKRLAYNSETGEVKKMEFTFRPVRGGGAIRIFQIADSHNRVEGPVAAAGYFGAKLDLLILNGDIPNDCDSIQNINTIHAIAGNISKGEIPVIYARGNHENRGSYAEKLIEHIPTKNGNTFFTFRLGPLWGVVLDCGEDKYDSSKALGHTMVSRAFRRRETTFIKQIIANANNEYAAPGVKYRLVISHIPFPQVNRGFEQDLYREWCRLLTDNVHPQLMLSAHRHKLFIIHSDDKTDLLDSFCPVIVGSQPGKGNRYTGTAVTLTPEQAEVRFINQKRETVGGETLKLIP